MRICSSRCLILVARSSLSSSRCFIALACCCTQALLPPFPRTKSGFLCFWGFGTLVFGHFEHKIEVFVRFWGLEPLFSAFSSTKSRFLCFFGVWNPCFQALRAQNRGFCAFLGSRTLVFRLFEHKIGIFVLEQRDKWHREAKK